MEVQHGAALCISSNGTRKCKMKGPNSPSLRYKPSTYHSAWTNINSAQCWIQFEMIVEDPEVCLSKNRNAAQDADAPNMASQPQERSGCWRKGACL